MRTPYLFTMLSILFTNNYIFSQSDYDYYSQINKIEIFKENFNDTLSGWKVFDNTSSTFWIDNGLFLKNATNQGSYPFFKSIFLDCENNYEIEFEFQFLRDLKNSGLFFKLLLDNNEYGLYLYRNNKSGIINCYLGKWDTKKNITIYSINENTNRLTIRNSNDSLHFYLNGDHLSSVQIEKNGILKTISFYPFQKSICKINYISINVLNKAFEFSKHDIDELKNTKIALLPIIPSSLISSDINAKIEYRLTDYLKSLNKFQLINEEDIKYAINQRNINLMSLDAITAIEIGKSLKADAIAIGYINDFEKEEEYLGKEETSYHEADKYKRHISFTFNLKLISVYNGEIITNIQKNIDKSDLGFINIRSTDNSSSYNSNANLGTNLILAVIDGAAKGISESKLNDELLPFKTLEDNCIEEIIYFSYTQILGNSRLYSFKNNFENFYADTENTFMAKSNVSDIENYANTHSSIISDIDINIPKTREYRPNSIAVIIGNQDYEKISKVDYAINDCNSIKNYLINTLGFREGNILFSQNITKTDFEEIFGNNEYYQGKLYNMIKPNISDVFIFYSGHGAPGLKNNRSYLVPIDCDPDYLEIRGYSLELFYQNLAKLQAKSIIIIVDACFSGTDIYKDISAILPKVNNPVFNIPNGVILTSSENTESSCWYNEQEHGIFTYCFLKAIQNMKENDKNNDGKLSIQEIHNSIASQTDGVPYFSRVLHSKEQHPTLQGNKDIILIEF